MKSFWLKLNGDIIVDAIEFEFGDYIRVELPVEVLPAGINGGWYHWTGTEYVFDEALYHSIVTDNPDA